MTALSNRRIRQLNRQAEAVAALTVTPLARGGWTVVSGERAYIVEANPFSDVLACDCTAGSFGRACKHVAAVGQYIAAHAVTPLIPSEPTTIFAAADSDPAEKYIARDRAAAQARGRLPWTVGVNEER